MEIVTAREFRNHQSAVLKRVLNGEKIILSSRSGMFRITQATDEEVIAAHICEGLKEIKLIESGKLPAKSATDFLNELR